MKISDSVKYVGVNDHKIDLFEGQFPVPNGMAYNSYVILDEKIAVMDSVDAAFGDEWLTNVRSVLNGREPDFLVVQHMEMDHSANILKFADEFKNAKIVSSKMAFTMMKNMFGTDFSERQIVVSENFELELGNHTLHFITAPNVHWPEVVMTYEKSEKILFSADAFGKFGANDVEDSEGWECEARRYYFGIVGKFGANVQSLLKKASALQIEKICSLHGPVLTENLNHYISLYDTWSGYRPEDGGIAIAFTSVYGNTKKTAEKLKDILKEKGCQKVSIFDLERCDVYEAVEDAFRYSTLVLATTTYNGGIFPKMQDFIHLLTERNFQNRTVAFIENGSWAPCAAKAMTSMFENCKNITFAQTKVTQKIALTDEVISSLNVLADEIKTV